jgi:SAM-dependent methyltransferase
MSFDVSADAYGRFMGRYSRPLATEFVARLSPRLGSRVLDVGCGPGALTEALVAARGRDGIVGVDPSERFVTRLRDRSGVPAATSVAERLPFTDGAFDAALAQLVVHFMADPVAGLREMGRVTRPGGVVAASVWDHAEGGSPLMTFWNAALDLDPTAPGESDRPGVAPGQLRDLALAAGLTDVVDSEVTVNVDHPTFDEWWEPYTFGVGPAGTYVAGLSAGAKAALESHCREILPAGPFVISARAWTVVATSPG